MYDIPTNKYQNICRRVSISKRWQAEQWLVKGQQKINNQIIKKFQCNHQQKITEMKLKIRELQCEEKYLMQKNDQILRDMQVESSKQAAQQEENQMWKLKYERLKAENDRKALRLTNLASGSVLTNKNQNVVIDSGLKEKSFKSENFNYKTMTQPKLTREQKQYVQQLQHQKRLRSASLKGLQPSSAKRYTATLPDGLVIHILDNRIKTHRENRNT